MEVSSVWYLIQGFSVLAGRKVG